MVKVKKQESDKVLRDATRLYNSLTKLHEKYHDENDLVAPWEKLYSKAYDALEAAQVAMYDWID